jgi:hypothetical protein
MVATVAPPSVERRTAQPPAVTNPASPTESTRVRFWIVVDGSPTHVAPASFERRRVP